MIAARPGAASPTIDEQGQADRARPCDVEPAERERGRERDGPRNERRPSPERRPQREREQGEQRDEPEDDVRGGAAGVVRRGQPAIELHQRHLRIRVRTRRQRWLLAAIERLHGRLEVVDRDEAGDLRPVGDEEPVVPAADDRDPVAPHVVDALAGQRQIDRDRARAPAFRHLGEHACGVCPAHGLPAPRDQQPLRARRRRLSDDDPNMVRPGRRSRHERGHREAHG